MLHPNVTAERPARGLATPPAKWPQSERQPAAAVPWYRDPTALAVMLIINGYSISGIIATFAGVGESSLPSILVRLLMIGTCTYAFVHAQRRGPMSRIDPILIMLWLVYSARLIYDWNEPEIEGADIALLFFVLTCVYPAATIAAIRGSWNDQNIARAFIVSGLFLCLGALQLKDLLAGDDTQLALSGRLGFAKLNPITLGHIGCTTLLAALVLWFGPSHRWRLFAAGTSVAATSLIIVAASRGPLVSFGSCLFAYVVCRRMWLQAAILGGVIVIAATTFALFDVNELLQQTRFARMGIDQSSAERRVALELAISEIKDHWQFGSSYTLPYGMAYPHNITVEAFMAMGVIGFALYVIVCVRAGFAAALNLANEMPMAALIYLQFFIAAQFSGSLYIGWSGFWLGAAVLLSGGLKSAPKQLGYG